MQRRFQFGLRTMLVVVAVVAFVTYLAVNYDDRFTIEHQDHLVNRWESEVVAKYGPPDKDAPTVWTNDGVSYEARELKFEHRARATLVVLLIKLKTGQWLCYRSQWLREEQ